MPWWYVEWQEAKRIAAWASGTTSPFEVLDRGLDELRVVQARAALAAEEYREYLTSKDRTAKPPQGHHLLRMFAPSPPRPRLTNDGTEPIPFRQRSDQ